MNGGGVHRDTRLGKHKEVLGALLGGSDEFEVLLEHHSRDLQQIFSLREREI